MASFAGDIRPLFRDKDIQAMTFMFDLSRYDDVKENADGILETVANGGKPCAEAWSTEQVSSFKAWMGEGLPE